MAGACAGRGQSPSRPGASRGTSSKPPARPEIVSGNRGVFPAPALGQRGDKAVPTSLVLAASQLTLLTGCFDLGLSGSDPAPRACSANSARPHLWKGHSGRSRPGGGAGPALEPGWPWSPGPGCHEGTVFYSPAAMTRRARLGKIGLGRGAVRRGTATESPGTFLCLPPGAGGALAPSASGGWKEKRKGS